MADTLDELLGSLVDLETADHAVRFAQGDAIVEWLGTHRPKRGEGKAFWGALASSIRHSAGYVRDLYRVSKAFPKEHRDPEHDWSWFRECSREDDPIAALKEYDEWSVREIRESRRPLSHEERCPTCGRKLKHRDNNLCRGCGHHVCSGCGLAHVGPHHPHIAARVAEKRKEKNSVP